jgi:hypothetical protein
VQSLIAVAALSLLGQFVVGMFNWGRRHDNFVYQLFGILTRPVVRVVRGTNSHRWIVKLRKCKIS